MKTTYHDAMNFDFSTLASPEEADDVARVITAASGTYRSNWSRLKVASQASGYACVVNAHNLLFAGADRVIEKNAQPAERALMLWINHTNLVGGIAVGSIALTAFAQESFVRLAYQLALELRLQRSRADRGKGFGDSIVASLAEFDTKNFRERLQALFKEIGGNGKAPALKPAIELMEFRNSFAHDAPTLFLATGEEIRPGKRGKAVPLLESYGPFSSLGSEPVPVRLKHVRLAIDAHDALVGYALANATRVGWVDAITEFRSGIGMLIRDCFPGTAWYSKLKDAAKTWESDYQRYTRVPIASFLEMKNSIVRRAEMRKV